MDSGNENWNLWPVHAFVDGLVHGGVLCAVISPGSRNTPLTLALAEHPKVQTYTHMDERSAAFFALGLAKSTGKPVAIVCTSGTATANYYPAVMEAFESRVPLIILTADRPPQLRDVGANQAVRQHGMYGAHVKWALEMPVPNGTHELARHAGATAARVAAVSMAAPQGPVHVNYPFEEPLMLPLRADLTDVHYVAIPQVYVPERTVPSGTALNALEEALSAASRPLIVLGPSHDRSLSQAVLAFAGRCRIPVLPDVLSQARFVDLGADPDPRMNLYDLLLSSTQSDSVLPDFVLRFGAQPTSKSLSTLLQRIQGKARVFIHDETESYRDASFVATDVVLGDLTGWMQSTPTGDRADWLAYWDAWHALNRRVSDVVETYVESHWFEGSALREAISTLPSGAQLMIGNSRPIRDLDALVGATQGPAVVYGNRGVSGIDGIVSTAFGLAAGTSDVPTILCIGDVSFYHDLNGLLAARQFGVPLTILVVNNSGGGIFQHLRQADRKETLAYFTTPHELVFEPIVKAYGGQYTLATDVSSLREAVRSGLRHDGLDVIEIQFDNDASVRNFKQLRDAIRKALGVDEA